MEQIKNPGKQERRRVELAGDTPGTGTSALSFSINGRRIVRLSLVITGLLLLMHLLAHAVYSRFPHRGVAQNLLHRFALERDGNVPTLFSALLLFFAGILLYLAYADARQRRAPRAFSHWFVLSMIFFFLALDEATMIHEFTTGMIRSVTNDQLPSFLRHAWTIPYGLLLAALAVHYIGFLRTLPISTRKQFVAAGILYVGSAMGLEWVEGVEEVANGRFTRLMMLLQTVEETLEMLAIILFLHALMQYLGRRKVELGLDPGND